MYDDLAAVYDWLTPDELLEPEGAAAVFAPLVGELPAGARVLDCACGPGTLAVGLALRGWAVTATDASPAMVARAGHLAVRRGVEVETLVCPWEELGARGWDERFAAVLCVGNSLVHAPGRAGRRAALAAMRSVLVPGGVLVVTSRGWERVRATRAVLDVAARVVVRRGRGGLPIRAWTIAAAWDAPHHQDVAVALLAGDGEVTTVGERLTFWPFRREELLDDLRAAGLEPGSDTWTPESDHYAVTARRAT